MSTSNTIVSRGEKNKEITLTDAEASEFVIGEARSDAMAHLGYVPADKLNPQEKATVDFFTVQYLIRRGRITQSAVIRMCLRIYESESFHNLGYESWEEYCDALATSDGTHAIEITPDMVSRMRILVPRLYAPLNANPIEILESPRDGPSSGKPRVSETISAETFLDGRYTIANELAPLLRQHNPLDPAFKPEFDRWVSEAAHSTQVELRRKMHDAGLKPGRSALIEKIPALRSLETHFTDPATGEIVDGEVTVVTLYLRSQYAERLFNARMGDFIAEITLANPARAEVT